VRKRGEETIAPTVKSGYLAWKKAVIVPVNNIPFIIQGLDYDIPNIFNCFIRVIAAAMSSIICSIVRYFIFCKLWDSSPNGRDSPKYLSYKPSRMPLCF